MKNALLVLTAFPVTVYAFEPEATLVDVLVLWAQSLTGCVSRIQGC